MKKLLGGIAISALLAAPALAADLPARMPVKAAPAPVVAAAIWTGCYIGANGGYGSGSEERTGDDAASTFWFLAVGNSDSVKMRGGLVGGQIGCNWQAPGSNWVFGIEFAGDAAKIEKEKTSVFFPASDTWKTDVSAILALKGRIGWATGANGALLPYITGGAAAVRMTSRFVDAITNGGTTAEERDWYLGGLIGAGLEYQLTPNWIIGVEYNHIWLGKKSFVTNNVTNVGADFTHAWHNKTHLDTIVGRISYKFGGPVVARY